MFTRLRSWLSTFPKRGKGAARDSPSVHKPYGWPGGAQRCDTGAPLGRPLQGWEPDPTSSPSPAGPCRLRRLECPNLSGAGLEGNATFWWAAGPAPEVRVAGELLAALGDPSGHTRLLPSPPTPSPPLQEAEEQTLCGPRFGTPSARSWQEPPAAQPPSPLCTFLLSLAAGPGRPLAAAPTPSGCPTPSTPSCGKAPPRQPGLWSPRGHALQV